MKKSVFVFILVCFLTTGQIGPCPLVCASAYAIEGTGNIAQDFRLPTPGVMVHLSPDFTPAQLKGITIHPENPLMFDFIIYKGDKVLSDQQKSEEYKKLVKYFLASLAVPDEDQWVNLSPYEKDRIIKDDFGKTLMGRDLLAQDYILKQITASLIYPEEDLGKIFWKKVYAKAQEQYGTTNIPVNTFNKVWIIPDEALIYEKGNTAYVLKNHLKVMLEEDYLALEKNQRQPGDMFPAKRGTCPQGRIDRHSQLLAGCQTIKPLNTKAPQGNHPNAEPATHTIGSQAVREIILPQLEKEVNEGKNFAMLRQVYSGMLLAAWFKRTLKQSILGQIYADKTKVKGIDQDPKNNEAIYQRYLRAYKRGVFNYIKEDSFAPLDGEDKGGVEVPRKYFSGGAENDYAMILKTTEDAGIGDSAMAGQMPRIEVAKVVMGKAMKPISATKPSQDEAMAIDEKVARIMPIVGPAFEFFSAPGLGKALVKEAILIGNGPVVSHKDKASFRVYHQASASLRNYVYQNKLWGNREVVLIMWNLERLESQAKYTWLLPEEYAVSFASIKTDFFKASPQGLAAEDEWKRADLQGKVDILAKKDGKATINLMEPNTPVGFLQLKVSILGLLARYSKISDDLGVYADPNFLTGIARIFSSFAERNPIFNSSALNSQMLKEYAEAILKEADTKRDQLFHKLMGDAAMTAKRWPFSPTSFVSGPNVANWLKQRVEMEPTAMLSVFGLGREVAFQEAVYRVKKQTYSVRLTDKSDPSKGLIVANAPVKSANLMYGSLDFTDPIIPIPLFLGKKEKRVRVEMKLEEAYEFIRKKPIDLPVLKFVIKGTNIPLTLEQLRDPNLDLDPDLKLIVQLSAKNPNSREDKAQTAVNTPGGIDLNSANLNMLIKRDGKGMVLPLSQQDLSRLKNIEGLDPVILSIKPASQTPLFSQLQTRP